MGSSPCLPRKVCVIWKWELVSQRQGPGWSKHVQGGDLATCVINCSDEISGMSGHLQGKPCFSWKPGVTIGHWKNTESFPSNPEHYELWLWFFTSTSNDTLTFKLLWQKVVITELLDLSSVLDLISRWQAMDCSAYKDFVGQLSVRQVGIFSYLWSSLLFVSDFSFPFAWSNFLGRTTLSCLVLVRKKQRWEVCFFLDISNITYICNTLHCGVSSKILSVARGWFRRLAVVAVGGRV